MARHLPTHPLFTIVIMLMTVSPIHSQSSSIVATISSTAADATLPNAPGYVVSEPHADTQPSSQAIQAQEPVSLGAPAPLAKKYAVVILAGEHAQTLSNGQKFILGSRDLYSPANLVSIPLSAGWGQLTNGEPNYGTDKGAYGQRLGAAAIRETSQVFLTEAVLSVALKEDPRYYVEGSSYNVGHRVIYAVTRTLLTRNDHGHQTPNLALLSGYAATTAMSAAYYPATNRNAKDMASSYGGSLGGAAIGFLFNEFSDQLLQAIHLEKRR